MQSFFCVCKRLLTCLLVFVFCSVTVSYAEANNSRHRHSKHKEGICEEYVRGLYASQRYEFKNMHKQHLADMRPLYQEYERLEKRGGNERRKKDLEKRITRLDREFAKNVSKRFGKPLFEGEKIIQHGSGNDSPCGYSGYTNGF